MMPINKPTYFFALNGDTDRTFNLDELILVANPFEDELCSDKDYLMKLRHLLAEHKEPILIELAGFYCKEQPVYSRYQEKCLKELKFRGTRLAYLTACQEPFDSANREITFANFISEVKRLFNPSTIKLCGEHLCLDTAGNLSGGCVSNAYHLLSAHIPVTIDKTYCYVVEC